MVSEPSAFIVADVLEQDPPESFMITPRPTVVAAGRLITTDPDPVSTKRTPSVFFAVYGLSDVESVRDVIAAGDVIE